jgi:hypothetical protein
MKRSDGPPSTGSKLPCFWIGGASTKHANASHLQLMRYSKGLSIDDCLRGVGISVLRQRDWSSSVPSLVERNCRSQLDFHGQNRCDSDAKHEQGLATVVRKHSWSVFQA